VTVPGIAVGGRIDGGVLALSLIGEGLFDSSTLPDTPQLQKDSVEKVLTVWSKLDKDGYIGQDFTKSPIGIAPALFVAFQPKEEEKRQSILLPGSKAGLDVQGFAVSAGTPHAAEAYALASFLTTRPEASGRFAGTPARKSLNGATPAGDGQFVGPKLPAEVQALTEQAIANGLNYADMRYSDYLELALAKMKSDNLDAHAALQLVQQQAVKDEQAAIAKKGALSVTLATPAPIVVQPGKTTLKFGLTSFMIPLPNEEAWTKLAQEFAQNDPQVGKVSVETSTGDLAANAEKYDCFYLPYNGVPSAKLTSLLNLDPYLTADKSFDKSDIVGNIMSQLERDGKTWGLPVMIQPEALKYDSDQFSKANVPAPEKGWTIDVFVDALKTLKANSNDPSFVSEGPSGTHLLMLMAAYGGLPLDYHTNPPTINFTDPETVQAIRQVLDLAKNGYIKYEAIGSVGQVVVFGTRGDATKNPPITSQSLGGIRIARRIGEDAPDPYKSVTYPTGTKYNAISYGIGTAYISANSQSPDACYRWISYIAQHPELFSSMPARRSLINAQANTAAQGADVIAMYNQVDALLKDPKTISFPSLFEGGTVSPSGFITQHWLFEAFDNYVLHDADLDSALKDAENYAKTFQTCAATIAPYDPSGTQSAQEYQKAYLDCAVKADPRLKSFAEGLR
jgi:ABC-type glycerol-3-phosphate transport system substrate-binding protein